MKQNIYSPSYESFPEKEKERLEKWETSEKNKKFVNAFLDYLGSTTAKERRKAKLSWQLRNIISLLGVDVDQATKQDVQRVVNSINSLERYSEATKADYRRCIRQFYKWFKDEDSRLYSGDMQERNKIQAFYKFIEKEMSMSYKKEQIDPSTILTEEDIESVVGKCRSLKEIALLKVLHETGVRVGELLGMKIKDVHFNCVSARITVDGKTGMRDVPIIISIPALSKWLEMHPFRNDPEAALWTGENVSRMNKPLRHSGVVKIIRRSFERVGMKKKSNPHWFRHSRASLLAPNLTEVLLCKYMGWTLGSKQVKTYCHLCTEQLEHAYLKMQGVETAEKESIKRIAKCGCGTINEKSARYCFKCGRPLSVEIAIRDEELVKVEADKSVKLLMEIMQDPELLKKFIEFKDKARVSPN